MPIHATERRDYLRRRLAVYLTGQTITGSPVFQVAGFERVPADATGPLVRLSFIDLPGRVSGEVAAGETAVEEALQVVLDLYWPTAENAYAVDEAQSQFLYALRELRLSLQEYSTPASPTATVGYLRVALPPEAQTLPSEDHYDRRRVTAIVNWFSQHS